MSTGVPAFNAQAMFYEQYESVRRDEVVGILLALFLGTFGIHHFYLRRTGLGILYLCFFWAFGLTTLLGFIECFFMPGRVREFNAIQAATIAATLGMPVPPGWGWPAYNAAVVTPAARPVAVPASTLPLPGPLLTCGNCQHTNVAGARFCSVCGSTL